MKAVTEHSDQSLEQDVSTLTRKPPLILFLLTGRRVRRVLGSVLNLGIGEGVSRVASFLFFAFISRRFGVALLGAVALAQTVAMYITLGTDQGLRLAGARLVARNAGAAPAIIREVLLKRLLSCAIFVTIGVAYAIYGPVPSLARLYILGFVVAVIPYAFSLDWLAWGLDKFAWLGGFRAGVSVLFLAGSVIGILLTKRTLLPITVSNGVAAAAGAVALYLAWRLKWRRDIGAGTAKSDEIVKKELQWFTVVPLGMATILNQAFHNADTLVLGAMSTVSEVGRYSSAYKILFLILGGYWLVTNSLYPKISRAKGGPDAERLLKGSLWVVGVSGLALAIIVTFAAPTILTVVYGADLGATGLLRILAFAIPMDFCVALLGTVFVSRGRDRIVLIGTGTAAGLNILLNVILIPRFQAMGAAYATLISYAWLLAVLLWPALRQPVFEGNHQLC